MNRLPKENPEATEHLDEIQRKVYLAAVGTVLRLSPVVPLGTAPWNRPETSRSRGNGGAQ